MHVSKWDEVPCRKLMEVNCNVTFTEHLLLRERSAGES